MKVIIAGSRTVDNYDLVCGRVIKSGFNITEVVSGKGKGVGELGILWAKRNEILFSLHPLDYDRYGNQARIVRNIKMAEYVGVDGGLIAITNGDEDTESMIGEAIRIGLAIHYCFVRRLYYEHV